MLKSESLKGLAAALAKFQEEVGNVAKDGVNPFYKSKYATLENVISTVKPFLAKHGLSYTQFPDGNGLTTILMHSSGEFIEARADIILKDQTPQGQGSAITYMRRYALSGILGIATEDDDDGQAASKPQAKSTPAAKPTAKIQPPKSVEQLQLAKKKLIAELCDALATIPLLEATDYAQFVAEQTGLTLEPHNYEAIIERLEALK